MSYRVQSEEVYHLESGSITVFELKCIIMETIARKMVPSDAFDPTLIQ